MTPGVIPLSYGMYEVVLFRAPRTDGGEGYENPALAQQPTGLYLSHL